MRVANSKIFTFKDVEEMKAYRKKIADHEYKLARKRRLK
jgi:hypothetical protein